MEKEPHKPVWQDVAPSNDTVKKHCQRWDLLVVENDILYYKWESEDGRDFTLKLGVPKELQTLVTVTQQLHNSVTSGHLGIKKLCPKSNPDISGINYVMTYRNGVPNVIYVFPRKIPQRNTKPL